MLGAARWTVVSALVAGWLLLPSAAFAIVPSVHDNGKFFQPETVKKANAVIKRIEDKYKKDVVVETFAEIPEEVIKKHRYDGANRDAFYRAWVDDVADEVGANG